MSLVTATVQRRRWLADLLGTSEATAQGFCLGYVHVAVLH